MLLFRSHEELSVNKVARHRIFLTEALGTFIFVYCGDATIAQVMIGDQDGSLPRQKFYGDNSTVALGYGLALFLAFVLCGSVFNPHLNPAVTVMLTLFGDVRPALVPVFLLAQMVGAVLGSLLVGTVHGERLLALPGGKGRMAYATYPLLEDYNLSTLLWDQVCASTLFSLVYLAAFDRRNMGGRVLFNAGAVGATYAALILSSGMNAMSAVNPFRDFFPRVTSYFLGHGDAFDSTFVLFPLFLPFLGSLLGGLLYFAAVGWFWPDRELEGPTAEDELLVELEEDLEELKEMVITSSEEEEEDDDDDDSEASEESLIQLDVTEPTDTSRRLHRRNQQLSSARRTSSSQRLGRRNRIT